ncbi:MAG: hypothetical protein MJ249_05060 [Kiritimatiellae bacterium]|nr:hypothetical protein [Kiritimatiellia bacterium]
MKKQKTNAMNPTLADELDQAKSHYSKSLADVDFLRVELGLTESAIRRQLDNYTAPPTPIGELVTEQGRTVRGALVAFCDFLKRMERNLSYNDTERGDCLFYWYLVAPLICEYLKRRGAASDTTARLAGLVTEAKPKPTSKGDASSAGNPFAMACGVLDFEKAVLAAVDSDTTQVGAPREGGGATAKRGRKITGEPLRQNGQIIEPKGMRENGDVWNGQRKPIKCEVGRLVIGKDVYPVPFSLRGFVSDLLTAYENGGWVRTNKKRWQNNCRGKSASLLNIIEGRKISHTFTGEYRLWVL